MGKRNSSSPESTQLNENKVKFRFREKQLNLKGCKECGEIAP